MALTAEQVVASRNYIDHAERSHGWTQSELAAALGVSPSRIVYWRMTGVYSEQVPGKRIGLRYSLEGGRVRISRKAMRDFVGELEGECHSVLGGLPTQANRWMREELS